LGGRLLFLETNGKETFGDVTYCTFVTIGFAFYDESGFFVEVLSADLMLAMDRLFNLSN
jgi:hypothetical protein